MKDLYLVRRDVLDRVHQNPNALPIIYPDKFGEILHGADVAQVATAALARLGLEALEASVHERLVSLDKSGVMAKIKAKRDVIGYLDKLSYDTASAGSRAAWEILWEGMHDWDNRTWNWEEVVTGAALAGLTCPPVDEREHVVLSRGSVGH